MKIRVSDLRDIIRETIDRVLSETLDKREDDTKDAWDDASYKHWAHKLIMNYGASVDFDWSRAVINYARFQKSSTGVTLDPEKLFKAVQDEIEQREEDMVNPSFELKSVYDK